MALRKRNGRSKRAGIGGTRKREQLEQKRLEAERLEEESRLDEESQDSVSGQRLLEPTGLPTFEISSPNNIPLGARDRGDSPRSSAGSAVTELITDFRGIFPFSAEPDYPRITPPNTESDKENSSPFSGLDPTRQVISLRVSPPFFFENHIDNHTKVAGPYLHTGDITSDIPMTLNHRREREYDRVRDRRPPIEPRRDERARYPVDRRSLPSRDPSHAPRDPPKKERAQQLIVDPVPKFDINEVGPHPGFIEPCRRFVFEFQVQRALQKLGTDQKDETWRMQGVSFIESIRTALRLYVVSICGIN
jgi:hypothetical protein